jgi:ubiquinone/menaquinone biosynthesis C-methylase UbiE
VRRIQHSSSDASRRYHDRVARRYDSMYEDEYWRFHDRLTWSAITPHIPADLSSACCDLGCGTGKWGLKLLKSGYPVTFVDHAANMIEQVRSKLGPRESKATLLAADMVDMPALADGSFALTVAMGDPLSICSDPARAAREMFRICRPGGVVIATADNHMAALEHYFAHGSLDELETFVHTGRTHWLTDDKREQFPLTTFTPATLDKLFSQAGFEVLHVTGKTILPLRRHQEWLSDPEAVGRLMRLEQQLAHDPSSAAIAAHLQITARRRINAE